MSKELKSGENGPKQGPSTIYDELKALAQENGQNSEYITGPAANEETSASLKRLGIENVPEDELVGILEKASTTSSKDELRLALRNLRIRRQAGNSTYRINDSYTYTLDLAVVKLVQDGHFDLAKDLVSSSPQDSQHLERVLEYVELEPKTKSDIKTTLEKLCQQKQDELRQELKVKGVSEAVTDWIIIRSADPDSAADIPSEFWLAADQQSSLTELLESGGSDLAKTAGSIDAIKKYELQEYNKTLLKKVISIGDKEKSARYLASLSLAIESLGQRKSAEEEFNPDISSVAQELANFEDPMSALKAANAMYGSDDPQKGLRELYRLLNPGYGVDLARFREEDIASLKIMKEYCDDKGIADDYIQGLSAQFYANDNPVERAKNIAEGLRLANVSADSNLALMSDIARAEYPIALGRAASIIEASIKSLDDSLRREIQKVILNGQNPETTANEIVRSIDEIQKYGLTIEDIGVRGLFEVSRKEPSTVERYCSDWKIGHESELAYQEYWRPAREIGQLSSINIESKPKIVDLPELSQRLESLGIPPQLAQEMFASWASYSSLRRRLYKNDEMRTSVNPEDIDGTLAEQGQRIAQQAEALTTYVERFGAEEALAIIETFGIYNFMRYRPELLHEQLISWKSGALTVKNVVVGARSDWNGAVDDVGSSFHKLFGDDGLFFFEANDSTELAKVAVAVGNRERANGRIPEEVSGLENFVIDGHANPEGILLGTEGQRIDTDDYLLGLPNSQKSNNYQRHLGKRFRVILKACSTAGEVTYGKNIAESIADYHDVKVEASKEITSGSIIIDPDGTVRFNGGDVPSTVYT